MNTVFLLYFEGFCEKTWDDPQRLIGVFASLAGATSKAQEYTDAHHKKVIKNAFPPGSMDDPESVRLRWRLLDPSGYLIVTEEGIQP